jgi:hypothetical protein
MSIYDRVRLPDKEKTLNTVHLPHWYIFIYLDRAWWWPIGAETCRTLKTKHGMQSIKVRQYFTIYWIVLKIFLIHTAQVKLKISCLFFRLLSFRVRQLVIWKICIVSEEFSAPIFEEYLIKFLFYRTKQQITPKGEIIYQNTCWHNQVI